MNGGNTVPKLLAKIIDLVCLTLALVVVVLYMLHSKTNKKQESYKGKK